MTGRVGNGGFIIQMAERWRYFSLNQDTAEWKQAHDSLITATKVDEITRRGKSRLTLWKQLMGHEERPDLAHIPAIQWGREHEGEAINHFFSGNFSDQFTRGEQPGLVVHPTMNYFASSPDHIMLDRNRDKWTLLEIKCPSKSLYDSAFKVPKPYIMQCSVQMLTCGIDQCILYFWTPTETRAYLIEASQELFEWIEKHVALYHRFLEFGTPPNDFTFEEQKEKSRLLEAVVLFELNPMLV